MTPNGEKAYFRRAMGREQSPNARSAIQRRAAYSTRKHTVEKV